MSRTPTTVSERARNATLKLYALSMLFKHARTSIAEDLGDEGDFEGVALLLESIAEEVEPIYCCTPASVGDYDTETYVDTTEVRKVHR